MPWFGLGASEIKQASQDYNNYLIIIIIIIIIIIKTNQKVVMAVMFAVF